jgi:hypothetical protein
MNKISSSKDLSVELQHILNYASSPNPSRNKLASDLRALAFRVAGEPYQTLKEAVSDESKRRNKVNKELHALCYNKYHEFIPVKAIREILIRNGFDATELEGIYTGRDGHTHDKVGDKTYLSLSWHKMDVSGNYEINVYVS